MINLFKKILTINLLLAHCLFLTNVYGAELTPPVANGVTQTAIQQFNRDPVNFAIKEQSSRTGLLSHRAYHAALAHNFEKARRCFREAAAQGDELSIRYLAKSYKQGGLITGFDKAEYTRFKRKKSPLPEKDVHRVILKSIIKIANQRLEAAFYCDHPQYEELEQYWKTLDSHRQTNADEFTSPHIVVPDLIEKYLSSYEINEYWQALERIVIGLNSEQLYASIRRIINDRIAHRTTVITDKESNVLILIGRHETKKELREKQFRPYRAEIYDFLYEPNPEDKKKVLIESILKTLELIYASETELALNDLKLLLNESEKMSVPHYCQLLKFACKKKCPFYCIYAAKYLNSHLLDLMKLALSRPAEMKTFEGTILSIDNIINEAFEAAQQGTDVEALNYFLINGSHLFEQYTVQIKGIFFKLILHRDKIFEGVLALLKSARFELITYCFEILVEQLANLEQEAKDSTPWVDKLLSQDLSGIYGDPTPLAAYKYCFQKFTEKTPLALQALQTHFPQYQHNNGVPR